MYLFKRITAADLGAIPAPPVCDFCALHAPEVIYAASQTQAGVKVRCWRWCACPGCHALVQAQDWPSIIRNMAGVISRGPLGQLASPELRRRAADQAFGDFHKYVLPQP